MQVFWGRGLFTSWGMLPFPRALTTVVGAPIPVQQIPRDQARGPEFDAAVDQLHARFLSALTQLWDDHKVKLAPNRKGELRLM